MSEDEQFLAIRDSEFAEDAREMMAYSDVGDGQSFGDVLIFQSQSDEAYDFSLTNG